MEHTLKHDKAVKHTLEDSLLKEFNSNGDVVFKKKLRHPKSVTFTEDGGLLLEFDKWGRTTFMKDSRDYWTLKYYNEPTDPNKVDKMPYHVVHKYWELYNGF